MTRFLALGSLVSALCFLLASPASAKSIFFRSFNKLANGPITPGETMRFVLNSEGSEPFVFEFPVPAITGGAISTTILEADAATYGINWAALETLLEGQAEKSTDFGPVGNLLHGPMWPYPGYLENVNLTRINTFFQDSAFNWAVAGISFSGDYAVLAPEPSSLALFGLCFGLVHTRGRRSCRRRL